MFLCIILKTIAQQQQKATVAVFQPYSYSVGPTPANKPHTNAYTNPKTAAKGHPNKAPAPTPATARASLPSSHPAQASIVVHAQNEDGRNAEHEMNWPAESRDTRRTMRPVLGPQWCTTDLWRDIVGSGTMMGWVGRGLKGGVGRSEKNSNNSNRTLIRQGVRGVGRM